jgi:hypothetical protein
MTSKTFNRYNSKRPEAKFIYLFVTYSSQIVLELYLGKGFYLKNAILGYFLIKK